MSWRRRARLSRTISMVVAVLIMLFDLSQAGAERQHTDQGGSGAASTPAVAPPAQDRDSSSGARRGVAAPIAAVPPAPAPPAEDPFTVPAVASYLASVTATDLTAAVYDVTDGQTFVYRPGVTQDVASIIKVDILTTLLAANARTHNTVEQPAGVPDQGDDRQERRRRRPGAVEREGGGAAVGAFDLQVGMTQTVLDPGTTWGLSTTSALDQVLLLRAIAAPGAALNDASRNCAPAGHAQRGARSRPGGCRPAWRRGFGGHQERLAAPGRRHLAGGTWQAAPGR